MNNSLLKEMLYTASRSLDRVFYDISNDSLIGKGVINLDFPIEKQDFRAISKHKGSFDSCINQAVCNLISYYRIFDNHSRREKAAFISKKMKKACELDNNKSMVLRAENNARFDIDSVFRVLDLCSERLERVQKIIQSLKKYRKSKCDISVYHHLSKNDYVNYTNSLLALHDVIIRTEHITKSLSGVWDIDSMPHEVLVIICSLYNNFATGIILLKRLKDICKSQGEENFVSSIRDDRQYNDCTEFSDRVNERSISKDCDGSATLSTTVVNNSVASTIAADSELSSKNMQEYGRVNTDLQQVPSKECSATMHGQTEHTMKESSLPPSYMDVMKQKLGATSYFPSDSEINYPSLSEN